MVWQGTTKVGCGWAHCGWGDNVVCQYEPRGNIVGDNNRYFRDNVGRQITGNPNDQYRG